MQGTLNWHSGNTIRVNLSKRDPIALICHFIQIISSE